MRRNLGSLLVVIVGVLLCFDIVSRVMPRQAMAQLEPPRHLVSISNRTQNGGVYRAWSDGTVEVFRGSYSVTPLTEYWVAVEEQHRRDWQPHLRP